MSNGKVQVLRRGNPRIRKFCSKCGGASPVMLTDGTSAANQNAGATGGAKPSNRQKQPAAQPIAAEQMQQEDYYAEPPATNDNVKPQKKSIDSEWFNRRFIALFVIGGLLAFGLSELAMIYISTDVSNGFGITLAVFALIFAISTVVLSVVKFFVTTPKSEKGRTNGEIICFAVGIIIFVYVLLSSIAAFAAKSAVSEMVDFFDSISKYM